MIDICDELELRLYSGPSIPRTKVEPAAAAEFDKKAYQREYMRKRRAKK